MFKGVASKLINADSTKIKWIFFFKNKNLNNLYINIIFIKASAPAS